MTTSKILAFFSLVIFFSLFLNACQGIAERAGKRETKATEELISKSTKLQKLEEVCRDLPFFNKITPSKKGISRQNDEFFYYYNLKINYEDLKKEYKNQMPKDGWTFKREQNGIWENQLEFEKGNYWIQIANGNFGKDNYGTNCKDSTIAN